MNTDGNGNVTRSRLSNLEEDVKDIASRLRRVEIAMGALVAVTALPKVGGPDVLAPVTAFIQHLFA